MKADISIENVTNFQKEYEKCCALIEDPCDFETMYEKSEEIYNEEYSKGEYCHEQSFKWGFQEGFDYAMSLKK